VLLAFCCAEIDDGAPDADRGRRRRVYELLGEAVAAANEQPLARRGVFFDSTQGPPGGS
jgi:hypothetical protein